MEKLESKHLRGPRTYFPLLDHRAIGLPSKRQAREKLIERRLKSLLLTKSLIVIAASHLTSENTYKFFQDNPFLLHEGHIIPALRSDRRDIEDLFDRQKSVKKVQAEFYKDHVNKVVTWELVDNSRWFRDRLVNDLYDPGSLVANRLRHVPSSQYDEFVSRIAKKTLLSRREIENASGHLNDEYRKAIMVYAQLLYCISGSRVVNCEGYLPQENYTDYDLTSMEKGRTKLSDENILFKLFIEMVFDSLQSNPLPIEILDSLTFREVVEIRAPLLESAFQNKYDVLIGSVLEGINKESDVLFNLQELESIRNNLSTVFRRVVEDQVMHYKKKTLDVYKNGILKQTTSAALSLISFPTPLSVISSLIEIIKEIPSFIINLGQIRDLKKHMNDDKSLVDIKARVLTQKLQRVDVGANTDLLDMVNLLQETIKAKLEL